MIHEDYMKKQAQTDFAFDKSKGIVGLSCSPKPTVSKPGPILPS